MVLIKRGVQPRNLVILAAVANVARAMALPFDLTITSGSDGDHKRGSKHYTGEALDIRSKNFRTGPAKRAFLQAVLRRLGRGYQGLLEYEGQAREHFHVEYDPQEAR